MPYCVVKKCKNTSGIKNTGFTFHLFPRDANMREKWLKVLRKNRKNDCWVPSTHCVVCSAHFKKSDVYVTKSGRHRLKKTAIPFKNLFLPPEECSVIPVDPAAVGTANEVFIKQEIDDSSSFPSAPSFTNLIIFKDENTAESSTVPITYSPLEEDISDNDSIFDSPQMSQLKREVQKDLRLRDKKKLKSLRIKIFRLQKRNTVLKNIIKDFRLNQNFDDLNQNIEKMLFDNLNENIEKMLSEGFPALT